MMVPLRNLTMDSSDILLTRVKITLVVVIGGVRWFGHEL